MNLHELAVGETGIIEEVGGKGALRQHFLDMGVIPGAQITLVKYAPMGDPMEFQIHGYELTLRVADAERVRIRPLDEPKHSHDNSEQMDPRERGHVAHPGLGEGGRYHVRADEHPLPDGTTLTFALAGNQNCGKTTLFNQLTGSNQHVGNFPGVTVDRKSGVIRGHANTEITDLPGIYSMSPYSAEELVSRQFILDSHPTGIINIVDATNIERNLYLTMQLMELDVPMVIALNMMDEVQANGGHIRVNELETLLGVPVVPISAINDEGVDELVEHAVHVAHYQERPGRLDFCDENDHGGAVHRAIHAVMALIEDHAEAANLPIRFAATKIIEGDRDILERLRLTPNEHHAIRHIVEQMETERGLDHAAAIADMRYNFIERIVSQCVIKPKESREHERSRRIDKYLTGRWTAIPFFILILGLVFWLTFNVIGYWLQELVAFAIDALTAVVDGWLVSQGVNAIVRSLLIDGVFNALGTVLPIMPIIVTMFFFLSLLEDTGYMARIAFVMDKPLRRIGLSGRSVVPMLVGFGCTVPAVMSTRTLPSERDRKLTIAITPFMSCSTKLTIYAFLTAAFFPGRGGLIMVGLYLLGIAIGILVAWVNHRIERGVAVPFVMELPNYRMPSMRSVLQLMWEKSKDFLQRAFSVVLVSAIVIWALETFSVQLNMVSDPQDSILAQLASWIAPIFAPLGLADWRVTVALIAGFMAKEVVVSTMSVLYGTTSAMVAAITPAAAAALLVFCLLYTPCVAAIAAIKRELGGKWAAGIVVFQCVVAWVVAFVVHAICLACGMA